MTKRHGFKKIRERIEDTVPDYVATSAITSTAPDALEVLRTAKEVNQDIITLIGGVHPNYLFDEILRTGYVDYVVRGEGEETLEELLLALEEDLPLSEVKGIAFRNGHKVIATPPRPFIQDLDSLEPAWDLIEWQNYRYFVIPDSRLGAVSTSRGCNHNCTFCSQQKFWHQTWRGRRPENVVHEIEHLNKNHGVNVLLLPDEYPTKDRKRWERILDRLIEKDLDIHLLMETRAEDILRDRNILYKYRKAGVIHIYIGLEATDQNTLDLIKKGLEVDTGKEAIRLIHEHGMISETSFILGFPNETKESIKATLKLSKHYNPDFAHYLAIAPWPYADMYQELKPYVVEHDYRKYNLIDPVIKPVKMSLGEIDKAIIECYQSFYMGKLKELLTLNDEFKKMYIMHSMKLIMNSSFIVDKLGSIGIVPPQVKTLINDLEDEEVDVNHRQINYVSMATSSIRIDAPVEDVFAFVSNPANWTSIINGLKDIQAHSETMANMSFSWTYCIKGISLRGQGKIVGFEFGKKLTLQMYSLLPIRKNILFYGDSIETMLTVEVGYKTSSKVVSYIFNLIKKSLSIMEANAVLERIKTLCEGRDENAREKLQIIKCPVKKILKK
jgi:anaerobic magnesium-protoporphyrin IX monomethyl ester cyclase